MSQLDQDFEEVAKKINEEIKEAAKHIKKVNQLAKKAGLKTMYILPECSAAEYGINKDEEEQQREMMDQIDFDPLFIQLDTAGWLTSSMYC